MGFLIDTDLLIHYERSRRDVSGYIEGREQEEFFLSAISASELLYGVHQANESAIRSRRLAFVESVLKSFPIINIDLAVARIHSRMWYDLRDQGIMIGLHDSWIAATCLAYGLTLVSSNQREFERVSGLNLEVWK